MRYLCIASTALVIFLSTLIVACSDIANPLTAKLRAETALQQLPKVKGAMTVSRWEGTSGGSQEGCGVFVIEELIGTNDMPFDNVLDFYKDSAPTLGWQARNSFPRTGSFTKGDELSMGISSNVAVTDFADNEIATAQQRFRTLFVISLVAPLNPANYKSCRNY